MYNQRPASLLRVLPSVIPVLVLSAWVGTADAQTATGSTYEPQVGQAGKDVVWVPTPQATVDQMLEMAKVTRADYLIDLGSGDGRLVITAAKRGLRAHGIEYNAEMVELAKRNAAREGVNALATFEKADIFESDFSKASVISLFLLPSLNVKLRPTLLSLKPGTRIVSNTFTMEDWEADQIQTVADCTSWCTALLWIIPAKATGAWRLGEQTLTLTQKFQTVTGSLGSTPITGGRLRGNEITFTAASTEYSGRVAGETMSGTSTGASGGKWTATRR